MRDISNSFVIDERKNRKKHKKALKKAPRNVKKKAAKVTYIKAKSKNRIAVFLTVAVMIAALVTFAVGILAVDYNSCATGWNETKTEFAFANSQDQLDLTVMGRTYHMDTSFMPEVEVIAGRISAGLNLLKPPPVKLMDMLLVRLQAGVIQTSDKSVDKKPTPTP